MQDRNVVFRTHILLLIHWDSMFISGTNFNQQIGKSSHYRDHLCWFPGITALYSDNWLSHLTSKLIVLWLEAWSQAKVVILWAGWVVRMGWRITFKKILLCSVHKYHTICRSQCHGDTY